MRRFLTLSGAAAFLFSMACFAPAGAQQHPSIVVVNFSTAALSGSWWGDFQPGAAIPDLVTNELINAGGYNVVDRARLGDAMQQHQPGSSGSVASGSELRAGRLVGAHFLVEGDVLQFDQSTSGGGMGQSIPWVGGINGNVHRTRVTLRVAVRIVNTQNGQIVQAFDDEQTQTATSWGTGGGTYLTGTGGDYESPQFTSSSMGHLIDAEAKAIVAKIDTQKLLASAAATPSQLAGRIIAIDGANFILNIGSARGVSVGQHFSVSKTMQVRDPSTGHYLTVNEPTGRLEVTSVSGQTAIARKVSGKPAKGQQVQSEQP